MSLDPCDVAIVGAGPAGTAAALALAGSGRRVTLIEAGRLPRHKTCGGGVVRRAAARLGLDLASVTEAECRTAELVHHDPALRFACHRAEPIITMVMRAPFDALLARRAAEGGAVLSDATRLLGLRRHVGGWELATSRGPLRARFLIAADGAFSAVARQLRAAPLRRLVPALEVECFVPAAELARWQGRARFDFGLVPFGYAWVFPKRDHLSIGVLTTRRGAADLPRWFERYCAVAGVRPGREERHGFVIPSRPRADLFAHAGVLFVGDAAGLADPVTAEGITAAVQSGALAGAALRAGWPDPRAVQREYRRQLAGSLLRELAWARRLAAVLYEHPRVRAALFRWRGQAACEALAGIVGGEFTYAGIPGRIRGALTRRSARRHP